MNKVLVNSFLKGISNKTKRKSYKDKNKEEDMLQDMPINTLQYKEEFNNKLKDINKSIELIGKVCDTKMAESYEDQSNSIKSHIAQLYDDLSKLKFKLIEYKKQNTKEDYVIKLKSDLKRINKLVQDKDEELSKNNKTLKSIETNVNLLEEEKLFYNKEIKYSKVYKIYLQEKIKQLNEASPEEVYLEEENNILEKNNSNIINKKNININAKKLSEIHKEKFIKNNSNLNYNSDNSENIDNTFLKENNNQNDSMSDKKKKLERLEYYLQINKDLNKNKIIDLENKIEDKNNKLNFLDNFNNPILQLFHDKAINKLKANKNNNMKTLNNKDIFFENLSVNAKNKHIKSTANKDYNKLVSINNNFIKKFKTNKFNIDSINKIKLIDKGKEFDYYSIINQSKVVNKNNNCNNKLNSLSDSKSILILNNNEYDIDTSSQKHLEDNVNISLINNNSDNFKSLESLNSLHIRDKKELVKEFLEDELTKRIIYTIIYKQNPY